MKDVFVSFHTPDEAVAKRIVTFLESNGFSCFFAPRDMPEGVNFSGELVRESQGCGVFLLLFSKLTNNSDHVLREATLAADAKRKIMPVIIEDCQSNDDFKYYLSSVHRMNAYPGPIDEYLKAILLAVCKLLPEKMAPDEEAKPVTKFDYDPKSGIMTNPKDGERNVSFRTDTFINMMGGIYKQVAAISGDAMAQKIFFDSGHASGKNFADRINSRWGNGFSIEEMQKKIRKWCEFDSVVGWGKFEAQIIFDEEKDTFEGTLTITEAFIVDTVDRSKVCAFIRGYCTGVLDTLLGHLDVELTCRSCPLEKNLGRKCVFDIKMKG